MHKHTQKNPDGKTMLMDLRKAFVYFDQNTALKGVDFRLYEHDFVVLSGHNGSGKSTLLRVLAQEQALHQGSMHFGKKQPLRTAVVSQHSPQNGAMGLSLKDNIQLYLNAYARQSGCKKKLSLSEQKQHLDAFNPRLSRDLNKQVSALSGGEQQAFALALAMLLEPDLLLLDEHTAALDPQASASIMALTERTVQAQGITCVMITHNPQHMHRMGTRHVTMVAGGMACVHNPTN